MKQRKQILNELGCFSPHLSQHLLRLLLLLVTAIGGVGSSWADSVHEWTMATSNDDAVKAFFTTTGSDKALNSSNYGNDSYTPIGGIAITSGLKMDSSGKLTFTTNGATTITIAAEVKSGDANSYIYVTEGSNKVQKKVAGTVTEVTYEGNAGSYEIAKGNTEAILLYVKVVESSAPTKPSKPTIVSSTPTVSPVISGTVDYEATSAGNYSITVSCDDGVTLYTKANNGLNAPGTWKSGTWTERNSNVISGTINSNKTISIVAVKGDKETGIASDVLTINYTYQKLPAPIFNVTESGTFEISNYLGDDYSYYYTLDGSDPNTSSNKLEWSTVLSPGHYSTIKMFAVKGAESTEIATISDITVTAIYVVTFNAGVGGTCSTESLTEESAGVGVTLPRVTNNDGYKFIGWSTSNNPTSADAGVAGATYNPTANCTLYAYYTDLLPATVSVTGGGTYQVNDAITLTGSATPANGATIKGMYGKDNAKPYRWYTCNEDGSNMRAISSQQENTYSPSSATPGTYYFRFMARESDGTTWYKSTYSDVVTVVVNGIVPTITPSETAVDVEIENTKEITLSSPSTGAYSVSSSNEGKLIASVEGSTITLTPAGKGTATGITITITQAANGIYSEAQTTITANVVKHSMSAPTISCVDNVVTITPAVDGAFVYYSIDGNDPVENEAHKYTEPFTIDADCTVKAFAKANDYNDSPIASQAVTYVAPAADPTKVGAEDNTSAYNSVHSEVKEIAAGMTRHIEFKNYSDKGENWNNWILNVGTTEEKAKTPDVMQLRADSYDVLDNANTGKADNFNWSTFKNDMDGATVAMDVTNSGKHIYVNATITTTGGTKYNYSAISSDKLADATAYICLTVEKAHLTELNIGEESQAYELTYVMNEFGTTDYNDSYGIVTIKNAQGLALRKGTYVPTGEVVTYKAENLENPRYVFVKWASGYTDAERDITVATEAVNPCAVFLDKPGVTTPENIVTLSHPAIGTDGFKMYFTLDNSDPKTSASRYEYNPNTVAIRQGVKKVRAVAEIDGVYSVIQGTNVTYEPVTVLEAREAKVSAQSTFTNSTCVTSVAIGNDNKVQWGISPNSEIDESVVAYRSGSIKTATIQLTSTSAKKIVLSGYSGGSDARTITSIYVDGVKLTSGTDYEIIRSTYNNSLRKDFADRIVISLKEGHEISQNSDVTFNMSGNTCFCYFEIYGTSVDEFCEMPDVAPASYSSTDNLWSYTLTPAAGTIMKYVVVDLTKGEPLAGYPKESTEAVTISKSTEAALKEGLMIRAWSVDPAGVKAASGKAFANVESLLTPTLKFNVAEAKYNKDGEKYTTATPVLTVYPVSLLSNVTYTTDDATVGSATDGQAAISIGSGQGLATIDANLTVAEEVDGMKPGDYKATLKLIVADGIAYGLSSSDNGKKPKIRTKIELKDPDTDDLLLTMMYGGYKYKNGKFNGGTTDSWKEINKFVGYDQPNGETLSDSKKYVDGYAYSSQAEYDSRSEGLAISDDEGRIKWYSTSEKKTDGTNYAKYERIKPFSLPVRGAYFTFEPQENGVLTLYVLQNGSLNTDPHNEIDFVTGLSANPRAYYWFDQDGYRIEPTSVVVKQPLTFGTDAKTYDNKDVISSVLLSWKDREEYTNDASYKNSLDLWGNQEAVNANLNLADPTPQPIIRYREGYVLLQKAYVKYVVNVVAGKTYYFFSNNSKLGFAGVNFKKTALSGVDVDNTLALTQQDDVASTVKKSNTTVYKTATLARTFKQNTWNTITLPFPLTETQVENVFGKGTKLILFNGTTGAGDIVDAHFLEHVDQNILPGQPYFILPTGVDEYGNDIASVSDGKIGGAENKITFTNVSVPSNVAIQSYGSNVYDGDGRLVYEFVGSFAPTQVNKNDYYINANTGELIRYTGNGTTMNTYRAYLKNVTGVPMSISAVKLNSILDEVDDEEATAIMNILVNEMGVDIKPVSGVYNLAGQKVAESTKDLPAGIYVVNGKKISIK